MEVQVRTIHKFEGAYRAAAVSGVLTGVAAETATAGWLWALYWAPPTSPRAELNISTLVLQRFRARLVTIHGPTAAQEVGIDLTIARAQTVAASAGTAVTLTTNNAKKRTSYPTSLVSDMRIGNTGALTAGTQTLDATPIAAAAFSELAAGAAVGTGVSEILLTTEDLDREPVQLVTGEGLVLRNRILQGAAYTARLIVEIDWLEVQRY